MTVCCEHNPCPDRPNHFLGRFADRPWRCPQCGQWWFTVLCHSYADMDTGGYWEWRRDREAS